MEIDCGLEGVHQVEALAQIAVAEEDGYGDGLGARSPDRWRELGGFVGVDEWGRTSDAAFRSTRRLRAGRNVRARGSGRHIGACEVRVYMQPGSKMSQICLGYYFDCGPIPLC